LMNNFPVFVVVLLTLILLVTGQVIQGNALPQTAAQTHVIGAAALLSSILPVAGPYTPAIPRALLQLCFSMVNILRATPKQPEHHGPASISIDPQF